MFWCITFHYKAVMKTYLHNLECSYTFGIGPKLLEVWCCVIHICIIEIGEQG